MECHSQNINSRYLGTVQYTIRQQIVIVNRYREIMVLCRACDKPKMWVKYAQKNAGHTALGGQWVWETHGLWLIVQYSTVTLKTADMT